MEYLLIFNLLICALVSYRSWRDREFDLSDAALCALLGFMLVPWVVARYFIERWRGGR